MVELLVIAASLALVLFAGWLIAAVWRAPGHIVEDDPWERDNDTL